MSSRRGARVAALLAPVAILLPAAAHAEKVVTEDAVGDARKVNWLQEDVETDPLFVPAPEESSVDITRIVVAHGDRRLSITVLFRDLVRINDHDTFIQLDTPSQGRFRLGVAKEAGSRTGVSLESRRGDLECRGLRGSLVREDDAVRLSVPTACIGSPRWVQLGVGAIGVTMPDEQDPTDFELYADDGHRATLSNRSLGKGPKVFRG